MDAMFHPTVHDLTLHALSLQIAAAYHSTYEMRQRMTQEEAKEMADDLITAYRSIRRYIAKASDGKRHGAAQAHAMMQGMV